MKRVNYICLSFGIVAAALAWLGPAGQTQAVFTLTGTAAELVARGINADFELPMLARGDGESFSTNNIGAGWTFNLISGVANNFGVQDPSNAFYGTTATGPLPDPFEGLQLGFYNLNNPFSQAEIISHPIGRLRSGEVYTLNVAVGTRNTTAMNQIAYRVGLRASDGTDLGTFATALMVPNVNPTSIMDLEYTLNMSSVPSYVGDQARIVIGAYNTGVNDSEIYTNQNAQANFDNARLRGTFDDLPAAPGASLMINRQTGAVSLSNTGSSNLNILGYSLTSAAGSFDQAAWRSIAGNYDQPSAPSPGNGSIDSDDAWAILSASGSATNLSESELSGGNGGTLSTGSPIDLGNAWLRTPAQDVQGSVLLGDGSLLPVAVQYAGVAIPNGDLNGDGNVTVADWTLFKAGQGSNFTGLSRAQTYLKGDLTGDSKHDLGDFFAFRTAFDAANGSGSFVHMLAGVPEPGAGLLLAFGGLLTFTSFRQRNQWPVLFALNRLPERMVVAVLAAAAGALTAQPAAAQTGVAHWSFDSATLTIDGGDIIGVADRTTNHNATPGFGGTGGGTGTTHLSQSFPLATSSVVGQFGNALRFNGDNFLLFDNLTELMEANGAPSFSVSMWFKTEDAGGAVGSPYATLGNWGNEPAATGPTRFTYGFGPPSTTQMRAQTRFANPASGGGGTNGTDIIARSVTTPTPVNDGNWHMLTWTFDTTDGTLLSYFDGALIETFMSTAASFAMGDSSSAVGGMGIKGDTGTYLPAGVTLDEVYVFTGLLTEQHVSDLFSSNAPPVGAFPEPINLTLRVDPTDGQVEIRNSSAGDVAFSAYRITSSTGSLNRAGWDAISTGAPIPGFPQGDGSGNGWEAPVGGNNPADYNSDGSVDAADYVAWRNGNINGQQGYDDWRANFGATGGGSGGSDNELVEWYLTGQSTLAVGGSLSLGQAFDVGGDQNLTFQFTTSTGVRTGIVEYGAIGIGVGTAVPEPASIWLLVLAGGGLITRLRRRQRRSAATAAGRASACVLLTSLTVSSAMAVVTNDRVYRFGENGTEPQAQENAIAGMAVGSGAGNPAPGATLDHVGPSGSFQTLLAAANAGGALPVYQNLAGLGRSGLGILFDGTDDYLSGFSLGFPPISRGTINGGGSGTLNYNGVYQRGFQFWAYPHSGATAEQHVVSDTTEHGVRISSGGNWMLRHSGTNVNSNVPVAFNQWSHVMAAMPTSSQPHRAVLYVNGVALAAHEENYITTEEVNTQALIVGANTDANGTLVGTTNHFRGVLDELEMFNWGRGYNHLNDTFTDFGAFNFATDNHYASGILSGVPGDVNNSGGAPNQADIDAFVAGWLSEKRVNNIRVGDLTTFAQGDLNFDGITNLSDARLLIQALPGSGSGAGGLDLGRFAAVTGLAIPEPTTPSLFGLAIAGLIAIRSRRKNGNSRGIPYLS
jgi:hypothetical protein